MRYSAFRKLLERNASLVTLAIFLLGAGSVGLSFFLEPSKTAQNIFLSTGCSLIASSIVSWLAATYLVRGENLRDIIRDWGMMAIYHTRQEANRSADESFPFLRSQLDIMAWGLRSFRDAKDKPIREKVAQGLRVRILAPDPQSPHVAQRDQEEGVVPGSTALTLSQLRQWVDDLKSSSPAPENVELRFYKTSPQDFYFRQDDSLFIGPYLYGKTSQQTITYEFSRPSRGFDYYADYFESFWEISK